MKFPHVFIILAALVTLSFQLTIFNSLEVFSIKPDLLFFWIIISAYYLPIRTALFTNWLIGIMVDITSNSGLGTFGFLYLISGLIIIILKELFFHDNVITQTSIALVSTFLCNTLYGLGLYIFNGAFSFWFIIFKSIGITLYTTLFICLIFLVMDRIRNLIIAKQLKEELK